MIKLVKHAYHLLRSKIRDINIPAKRSPRWYVIRVDFLSRHPVCAICGSTSNLNVHHKKPFHLYPELELEDSNLITLCMSDKGCHLLVGHGNDFRAYNPRIVSDVKLLHKDISKFDVVVAAAKTNRRYK